MTTTNAELTGLFQIPAPLFCSPRARKCFECIVKRARPVITVAFLLSFLNALRCRGHRGRWKRRLNGDFRADTRSKKAPGVGPIASLPGRRNHAAAREVMTRGRGQTPARADKRSENFFSPRATQMPCRGSSYFSTIYFSLRWSESKKGSFSLFVFLSSLLWGYWDSRWLPGRREETREEGLPLYRPHISPFSPGKHGRGKSAGVKYNPAGYAA